MSRIPAFVVAAVLVAAGVPLALQAASGAAPQAPPTRVARGVALDPANRPDVYSKLSDEGRAAVDKQNELKRRALDYPPYSGHVPDTASTDPRVTPHPTKIAAPHREAGAGVLIEASCTPLFPEEPFVWSNRWLEQGPEPARVFCAGAQRTDPSVGVVMVEHWSSQRGRLGDPTPIVVPGHGWVRITDVSAHSINLVAKDGATFLLDLTTLEVRPTPINGPSLGAETPDRKSPMPRIHHEERRLHAEPPFFTRRAACVGERG